MAAWTINNNNPGAVMYGGQQSYFGSITDGIAAQVANWNTPRYQGQSLGAATNMWVNGSYTSTSQSSNAYAAALAKAAGTSVNALVDTNMITNPNFLQAQANWEAGSAFPASADQWTAGIAQGLSGAKPSATLNSGQGTASAASSGGWMEWLGHQFVRGGVVVLGLTFVGAGLGMFAIGILANPEGLAAKAGGVGEAKLRRKSMKASIKHAEAPAAAPVIDVDVVNLTRKSTEPAVSSRRRLLREGRLPAPKARSPRRTQAEVDMEVAKKLAGRAAAKAAKAKTITGRAK